MDQRIGRSPRSNKSPFYLPRSPGPCVPRGRRGGRTGPSLLDGTALAQRRQHAILGLLPGPELAVALEVVGQVAQALLVRDDLALELVRASAGAPRGGAALGNALSLGQLAELGGDQHGAVVDAVLVPEDVLPQVSVGQQLEAEGLGQPVAGEEVLEGGHKGVVVGSHGLRGPCAELVGLERARGGVQGPDLAAHIGQIELVNRGGARPDPLAIKADRSLAVHNGALLQLVMAVQEVETELIGNAELLDQLLSFVTDMIRNFGQVVIVGGERVVAVLGVISETRSCQRSLLGNSQRGGFLELSFDKNAVEAGHGHGQESNGGGHGEDETMRRGWPKTVLFTLRLC